MTRRCSMESSRLVDMDSTCNTTTNRFVSGCNNGVVGGNASHLLITPAESTRLSSVHQNSAGKYNLHVCPVRIQRSNVYTSSITTSYERQMIGRVPFKCVRALHKFPSTYNTFYQFPTINGFSISFK